MDEFLLPLFPLELVLFPEEILPLHIFEERYKKMIGECLAKSELDAAAGEFGVVLAQKGEAERLGCTARITRVIRRYDDGRLDILTRGQRRFEVLFTNSQEPYLRGAMSFFDDDGDAPNAEEKARAIRLFRGILARLEPTGVEPAVSEETGRPSFQIAAGLPLALDFKQKLLGLRSEKERLGELSDLMEKLIPALEERARVRSRASGNGHGARPDTPPAGSSG